MCGFFSFHDKKSYMVNSVFKSPSKSEEDENYIYINVLSNFLSSFNEILSSTHLQANIQRFSYEISFSISIRFSYEGVWKHELNHLVDFPLNNMDITEYVAGPRTRKQYNLYAVSVCTL